MSTACTASGCLDSTPDELDATLRDTAVAAQRTCPAFRLPPHVFVAYLRERLPADIPPQVALRQMHVSDLYLACACAYGDVNALAAFDERCLRQLDRTLSRMGIDTDLIAEIKQDIRSRVLVGGERRARIVEFCGRGDLRGWVRVMAVRQALQRRYRARREAALEEAELLQRVAAPDDPELEYVKGLYRQEFKQAFEDALRALPHRKQTVLRQHYIDGLTIDDLARLYRVHRSNAARLLARTRMQVLEATRERLMSQLDVPPHELDSILRMIWSRVEISLRGLRPGRKR